MIQKQLSQSYLVISSLFLDTQIQNFKASGRKNKSLIYKGT